MPRQPQALLPGSAGDLARSSCSSNANASEKERASSPALPGLERLYERFDFLRCLDRNCEEVLVDALGHAGEHLAGAGLYDAVDAAAAQASDRLAPAHAGGHLLDEQALDR